MILMTKNYKDNMYIKKYWVINNPSTKIEKGLQPMISDGHLEVLFIEGRGIRLTFSNSSFEFTPGIYLTGHINTLARLVLMPNTKIHFIKLQPWANLLVTKSSFSELIDCMVSLSHLNLSLFQKLKSCNPSKEIQSVVTILQKEFDKTAIGNTDFQIIQNACRKFRTQNLDFKTQKQLILSESNISDRTLENKFKRHVGLTPKQFSMTLKMRNSAEAILYSQQQQSLADVAFGNGFFDQSHFYRCFKSLFGLAPSKVNHSDFFIPNSNEPFRYYTI